MSSTAQSASRGPSRRTRLAAVSAGAALAAAALFAPSGGAQAAAANPCPPAYPAADLTAGQHVTGLTVSSGTATDDLEGTFVGTLEDGIAPGVDMLIFKMTGSKVTTPTGDVDRGIWAGMSGSPVYADDGRLIGSISYGLSYSPSDYAGVTPAAAIYKLKKYDPAVKAPLSKRVAKSLRASGASSAQVSDGMEQLQLPLSVNSSLPLSRIKAIAKKTHFTGHTFRKATGSARVSATPIPITAGGNIADSFSYGSYTIGSVGTATAVCGSDVYAYGHPDQFNGPTSTAMHGAEAVYVEKDILGSFKVANLGAPVGRFTQDRLTGIFGKVGALPPTTSLASTTRASNGNTRSSKSYVSVADALGFTTYEQVATDDLLALDGFQGGTVMQSWKFVVQRANGSLLTYSRSDKYADRSDATFEPAEDPSDDVFTIQDNDFEKAKIKSITTSTRIHTTYASYSISKTEARQHGAWVKVRDGRDIDAKAGKTVKLRVTIKPDKGSTGHTKAIRLDVKVPTKSKGKVGVLEILGNNSSFDDGFEDLRSTGARASAPTSLPTLLKQLAAAPHNDDITADLVFGSGKKIAPKSDKAKAPSVVSGSTVLFVNVASKK